MGNRGAVLVTRPSGQSAALCDAVRAKGLMAFSLPLLELQGLPEMPPEALSHLNQLDTYQHLIFISGNAVRFGMEKIRARWSVMPSSIQVYAMGSGSKAALSTYGVTATTASPAMTTESLLSLGSLQAVRRQKVLIVKGVGGRRTLREELSKRGAKVDDLVCYRRLCPQVAAGDIAKKLSSWQIGLILISSGEGLCNLLTLLSPAETTNVCSIALVVPSRRIARMAEEAGFTTVYTAKNASNKAMLEAVERSGLMSETSQ